MVAIVASVFAPGSESDLEDGDTITVKMGTTASGASPTIKLMGSDIPVLDSLGAVPPAGYLPASWLGQMVFLNGSLYVVADSRTPAAIVATVAGLTTGLVPANVRWINITSSDANFIATLPAGKAGIKLEGWVGANGCELRTPAASGETINNVNCGQTNEAAIPASSLIVLWCVSDGAWLLHCFSNLGAVRTAIVPDAA